MILGSTWNAHPKEAELVPTDRQTNKEVVCVWGGDYLTILAIMLILLPVLKSYTMVESKYAKLF